MQGSVVTCTFDFTSAFGALSYVAFGTMPYAQGSVRDRDRREKERQQLADLVGKNLTYISQLDGLGFELYAGQVRTGLPGAHGHADGFQALLLCSGCFGACHQLHCACFPIHTLIKPILPKP